MNTRSLPVWKQDFPIAWVDDHYVSRREFTKSLALVSCATFAANATLLGLRATASTPNAEPLEPRRIAGVDDLPVGGAQVFDYAGAPCLLLRLERDRFRAYGQKCTHLGCPVLYLPERDQLYCPCHSGYFDARTGEVLAGPPPRALPVIALEREGDDLWAIAIRT
jgi:Rieske Fe-S protein